MVIYVKLSNKSVAVWIVSRGRRQSYTWRLYRRTFMLKASHWRALSPQKHFRDLCCAAFEWRKFSKTRKTRGRRTSNCESIRWRPIKCTHSVSSGCWYMCTAHTHILCEFFFLLSPVSCLCIWNSLRNESWSRKKVHAHRIAHTKAKLIGVSAVRYERCACGQCFIDENEIRTKEAKNRWKRYRGVRVDGCGGVRIGIRKKNVRFKFGRRTPTLKRVMVSLRHPTFQWRLVISFFFDGGRDINSVRGSSCSVTQE